MRVRGTRNDFDLVSKFYQLARHVAGIDTLTSGVGVSAVSQECDAQWTVVRHEILSQFTERDKGVPMLPVGNSMSRGSVINRYVGLQDFESGVICGP